MSGTRAPVARRGRFPVSLREEGAACSPFFPFSLREATAACSPFFPFSLREAGAACSPFFPFSLREKVAAYSRPDEGFGMCFAAIALLLTACTAPKGGDSPDSPEDTDTGTPADCGQTHPWTVTTGEDVGRAAAMAGSQVAPLTLMDGNLTLYEDTFGADPCLEYTVDGDTTTIVGFCTTAYGVDVSGTATFVDSDTAWTHAYDHFHFYDPVTMQQGYDADGHWSGTHAETGGLDLSFDVTASFIGVGLDGTEATWRSTFTWDATTTTVAGYVDILSQADSAAAGDYCIAETIATSASCEREGDGNTVITGTATGLLSWAGSSSCDACADVTIDGRESGTYCP